MRIERLDYRQLPGQNPLFLDYLYDCDQVANLYSSGPVHKNLQAFEQRVQAVQEHGFRYPRESLANLLDNFNKRVGSGHLTIANINKLRKPGTVAVVTGQQLGLFGGPALSVYKALTAVRLARMLEAIGYSAVPVFWLPSDDSDFLEARSTAFYRDDGSLLRLGYSGSTPRVASMVGTVELESMDKSLAELQKVYLTLGRGQTMQQMVQSVFAPGTSFREAQGRWLAHLFENQGLILFDALQPGYKAELKNVFQTAVVERSNLVRALGVRQQELKDRGYDVQVPVDSSESFLFWFNQNRRYKLEYRSGEYRSRGSRNLRFCEQELLDRIQSNPEEFGPNVLLRPVLQDHLFPAAAYVGGPSEVSYYSQISAISCFWNLDVCIFPRVGVTVLDRKSQRFLKKYSLDILELLSLGSVQIMHRLAKDGDSKDILDNFDRISTEVMHNLTDLERQIVRADPSLRKMVPKAWRKVCYQLDRVEKRFVSNYRMRDRVASNHLDYLYTRLFPEEKLQERVVNFNQFLMEEGPGFIDCLLEVLDPFCFNHQVIHV